MAGQVTPDHIMMVGLGFWGSKTLLSACELGVFTELAAGPQDLETLRQRFGLHERSAADFFDALVALRILQRSNGKYANSPEADAFLDRNKPSYIGGFLEMANARLYPFWGSLTEGLQTGRPQNEAKHGVDFFGELYADKARLRQFMRAMTSISAGSAMAIAQKFPWDKHQTFMDIGAAEGGLPVQVALQNQHLTGGGFDLPVVQPIFEEFVAAAGLSDRLRFYAGNFFEDPLPSADVLLMGHIIHDWDLQQKRLLLKKAFDTLPKGGSLIVYDTIIDDDRSQNVMGLLMSLNML